MIDFIDVEKTYKSGVEALRGVNFTIEDGEFVFIIGKSGSGKSTLLKCITCEETPTSGKVTIDNFDISHMSRALVPVLRRKIGMIYQDFRLIETKTVAENVAFAGEIVGVPKQSLMNTVQICLSVVGLKDKADCYPQELSGGEQQRVAIARAMVNNPSLIVADEPTGNLDPETSEAIMAMLLEINRNGGTTVIICTHDSAMVDRMKQRVIEIEDGLIARDEKKSGYKGDQADQEQGVSQTSRTSRYGKAAVAFGDDEEYSDNYDDPDFGGHEQANHSSGLFFGDVAGEVVQEATADKVITPEEVPVNRVAAPVFDDEEIQDTPEEAIPEEPVILEEIISEEPVQQIPEEPVQEDAVQAEPEIIEINIPEEKSAFSFGDEDKKAEKPAEEPAAASVEAPAKNTVIDDPDITSEDDLSFPGKEAADESKDLKREQKRKAREEKLAQKEAKRRAKMDKKKKVRSTDFTPESDIDIFPEDDE